MSGILKSLTTSCMGATQSMASLEDLARGFFFRLGFGGFDRYRMIPFIGRNGFYIFD